MRTRTLRHRRFPLAALLVAALPATAAAQDTTVVVVQDPATPTHTVRKGDTLWDLAGAYLRDPFLWPEIYRINTDVVEDPHWIYPGEVLRIRAGADVTAVPGAPAIPGQEGVPVGQVAQAPAGAQDAGAGYDEVDLTPLFGRASRESGGLEGYLERPYRPLRRGEFHSAGFLTEGRDYSLGRVQGNVLPSELYAAVRGPAIQLHARIGVRPPSEAAYQPGDSLLLVRQLEGVPGFGDLMLPTGIAVVREANEPEAVAEVIEVYQAIEAGDRTLPLEPFRAGPQARAVPVEGGVQASVLADRDGHPFFATQSVLFLDRGSQDGVAVGDIFEVRRTPRDREPQADTVDDALVRVQVVRVGERTATALVLGVGYPRVIAGAPATQVAKLPS
jgi:hypothetical protein